MSLAEVIPMPIARRMQCSACGASATASCDCGAPYVQPGERAAQAIEESPEMSDRAIAMKIGVDHKTVGKARKRTGERSPVAKRTGRDGKKRKQPEAKKRGRPRKVKPPPDPIQDDCGHCRTEEERWQHSLGSFAGDAVSMEAFWDREFGNWREFGVPSSLATLVTQAAKAWKDIEKQLREMSNG